jgi:type VI secretion system protein ImpI
VTLRVELRRRSGETIRSEDFAVDAQNPLTFGRSAQQNRLHVPDEQRMVSSKHGRIELRGSDYVLVDLDSVNGTHFEGAPVSGELPLGDGGTIVVGDFEIVVTVMARAGAPAAAEQTMTSFDPGQAAQQLWQELCSAHASLRRAVAAERTNALTIHLRDRLKKMPPPQARAVLKRIAALGGGDSASPRAPLPEEELLQAGLQQLQQLAQALLPGRRFGSPREIARFATELQTFVQTLLPWLVQSLKGRAEFENEFGAEVTMVFQRSNNPLKGLEAADLAARLFDWSAERGTGEHRKQLEGLLRDLTQHQLGLLGGATEAIRSVTERLRPEAIETLAQKDAGLLTSKGAKAWEIYQKIYRELLEEKSKLFHEVISPAIRKGYLTVHEDGRPPTPPHA